MSDTPRTDAIISAIDMDAAFQNLCRQLELELAHSLANQVKAQAEVERLNEQLTHFDNIHCDCVPKLKAEVDRLTEKLTTISFNLTSQKEY